MLKRLIHILVLLFVCSVSGTCFSAITLPDSFLTVCKAKSYFYQSPDTALAILRDMQDRNLEHSWKLYMVEGDLQRRHNHYHAAIECYEKALKTQEVKDDIILQADGWRGMMNCHDMLMDDLLLMDDLYKLTKCSDESKQPFYKYLADFVAGKRLHLHGLKDKGYSYCLEALKNLKKLEYENKLWSLRLCYSVLVRLYRSDHLYDKAFEMSQLQEQMVRKKGPGDLPGERLIDLHNVYAQRASLLAEAGRLGEADQAYEKWQQTKPGNPYDEREILSYLLIANRLEEALKVVEHYKNFLNAEGDSINIRMLDALVYESHTYTRLNNYERALQNYAPMASIAYQLHQLTSKKEMQGRYKSLQERDRLNQRNIWLLGISLTLLGLLVILCLLIWYRHVTHRMNLRIQRAMNRIVAYQKAMIKTEDSPSGQDKSSDVSTVSDKLTTNLVPSTSLPLSVDESIDDDERLFVELDTKINREQLFLKPNLSREDLMRLIGVDKNRIGRIMSRYSGTSNISTYINQKRAYYAANYIQQHPDYTIAAVVEACGMVNTITLNRSFKELFGMNPSDYRRQILDGTFQGANNIHVGE